MLDFDFCCEDCLKEAIERRFLFYPNHEAARVTKVVGSDKGVNCSLCKGKPAVYSVSIIIGSLKQDLLNKRIPSH